MRTITLIGFATLAAISTSAMAASVSTVGSSNAVKTIPTIGSFITHNGPEAVVNYDVTGIPSMDAFGDPSNANLQYDVAAALGAPSGSPVTITGVGWDVAITAYDPSWLSEITVGMTVAAGMDTGVFLTAGSQANPGSETSSSGGILDLTDNSIPDLELPNGVLYFQFYEGYDDADDVADGMWDSGFLSFEATASNIPEPTTLGLVALGSLISLRRARRA